MHFAISKENAEKVVNTLLEFPAKHTLNALDIMRTVVPIAEDIAQKILSRKSVEQKTETKTK